MQLLRAIGLMSGTSMDGIDVAMVETDGIRVASRGPWSSVGYESAFRRRLELGLVDAQSIGIREERPGGLAELEREITERHAAAVRDFMRGHGISRDEVDVIGFHGQTVLHRPESALTVQLGDGALLAKETEIDVVHDMRANDMVHGGQGAPLVPVYHAALASGLPAELNAGWGPVAFVNIGGIANVTFIEAGRAPVAFDCGPGNALIDQWVGMHAGIPYDDGGRVASEGKADAGAVSRYMGMPFFARTGPKSLDRGDFNLEYVEGMELSDGAATLAKVTALGIAQSAMLLDEPPRLWIVAGGGARNDAIMRELRQSVPDAHVITAGEARLDEGMMEAEAWGYLAVRSLKRLPLTFPSTTSCDKAVTGGVLSRASRSGAAN